MAKSPRLTAPSVDDWLARSFTLNGILNDPDGDGMVNLQEFAFGSDPTVSQAGALSYVPGGAVTSPGVPMIDGQPGAFRAIYARRKNYVADGITYRVFFSADLQQWTSSVAGPSVLTNPNDTGSIEAVSVPFPATVPLLTGGTSKPIFFRVSVTGN